MLKQIVITSFLVYMASILITYVFQRQLIYFPAKNMPGRLAFNAGDMETVTLHTDDGVSLTSWYKPAEMAKPTLLILHGNAGHIGGRMPLARQFISKGYGIFLLEYRGYGGNQGQPSEQGFYRDGEAAMQFLKQRGIGIDKTVLYGESLGTGVATQLASKHAVCALVLQSPYTSLRAVARYHYPWILMSPWDKFDSLARIRTNHVPLLILHGTQDQVIPYTEGLELYTQANEPKQWVALPNKGHIQLWDKAFVQSVSSFINLHCDKSLPSLPEQ